MGLLETEERVLPHVPRDQLGRVASGRKVFQMSAAVGEPGNHPGIVEQLFDAFESDIELRSLKTGLQVIGYDEIADRVHRM